MPSPRDDDEDDSLPLRPEIAMVKRASPAVAAGPKTLAWGVSGVINQAGDLNEFPGERGVIRYVTSGVRFVQPPTGWEWRAMLAEPGRFEMKWPEDPSSIRTVAKLRDDLDFAARSKQLDSLNQPLLKELDQAAQALARLAEKLHEVGWSVGLLRPDNVVFLNREAIPIDLGFTWSGTFGGPPWDDSPGRPVWLENTTAFSWLYDHSPVRQQFANPGNTVYPPSSAVEDVKTLGRLLAWLVAGVENHDLPQVSNAPPAWEVLAAAASGSISSAAQFLSELKKNPLSGYFIRPRELEPLPLAPSKSIPWALIASGLIGVAACAGVAWYLLKDKPHNTSPIALSTDKAVQPAVPVPPPIATSGATSSILEQIDRTTPSDLGRLYELLRKGYASASPYQKKALDERRVKALQAWIKEYRKADALAAVPIERHQAAKRFSTLKKDLEELTRSYPSSDPKQLAEEKQCLEFVSTRVRELSGSAP